MNTKNDLYHVVLYSRENTYSLLQHNLSGKDSEEQINDLHEQRLPAFRGRQTGPHVGSPHHCLRCQHAAMMMIETLLSNQIDKLEEALETIDSRALRARYHELMERTLPARQITAVLCRRCGEMMEGATQEWKRLLDVTGDDGFCPSCMATWLIRISPNLIGGIGSVIPRRGPRIVLDCEFQPALEALLSAADSSLDPKEVDWQKVYDRWNLPFPRRSCHGQKIEPSNEGTGPVEHGEERKFGGGQTAD